MGGVDEISVVVSVTIFQPNTRIPCINPIHSNTTLKVRKNPTSAVTFPSIAKDNGTKLAYIKVGYYYIVRMEGLR
jgi:hypothetical protein